MSLHNYLEVLLFSLHAFFLQPWFEIARFIRKMVVFISDAMPASSDERRKPSSNDRQTQEESIIHKIEAKTKRTITIDIATTPENLAKCNEQSDSPLWQLPQELRDLIFTYTSTQSPDPAHLYKETAYYYDPSHTARHITHTNIQLTCRRAWLEAHCLPMQQAEHAFWFQRGPYDPQGDEGVSANLRHEVARYSQFFRLLSERNLRNVTYIHFYMQMFYAEQMAPNNRIATFFPYDLLKRGLKPRVLEITIRHTDWYYWESDEALRLESGWVQAVLDSVQLGGVQEFRLELETLKPKKNQLDPIIDRLKLLSGRPKLADPTLADCETATRFTFKSQSPPTEWTRSARLDNKDHPIYSTTPTLHLLRTTLTWRNTPCPVDAKSLLRLPAPALQSGLPSRLSDFQWRGPISLRRGPQPGDFIRRHGWQRMALATKGQLVWEDGITTHAKGVEEVWRERFEKLMGGLEVERLEGVWKAAGSLLRFVEEDVAA